MKNSDLLLAANTLWVVVAAVLVAVFGADVLQIAYRKAEDAL